MSLLGREARAAYDRLTCKETIVSSTQPPAVPDVRWSPSENVLYVHPRESADHWVSQPASPRCAASWAVPALPADAVRLVLDEMDLLDANDRLGEALTEIGMALGLPKPGPRVTWGREEILRRWASIRAAIHDVTSINDNPYVCSPPPLHDEAIRNLRATVATVPDGDTTPDIDVREELVDVLDTHMRLDNRADAERVADVLIARPDLLRALLGADREEGA